jgi:hypothetical protein
MDGVELLEYFLWGVVVVLISLIARRMFSSAPTPVVASKPAEEVKREPIHITTSELTKYDGKDTSLPLYIAVKVRLSHAEVTSFFFFISPLGKNEVSDPVVPTNAILTTLWGGNRVRSMICRVVDPSMAPADHTPFLRDAKLLGTPRYPPLRTRKYNLED